MKLHLYILGRPNLHGHRRREFQWSPPHGVYLYEGKEFSAAEFNAAYERCMKRNADMNPRVRVADDAEQLAPVATISPAQEVTVEMAEAVMWRLAPEKMKKKPGPQTTAKVA